MEQSGSSLNSTREKFIEAAKYVAVYALAYFPAYFATVGLFAYSPAKGVYGVISGFWSAAYFGHVFGQTDYRIIPSVWVLTSGLYGLGQIYYSIEGTSDYALSDPLSWGLCLLGGALLSIPLVFNASVAALVRYLQRKGGLKSPSAVSPEQPMI